MIDRKELLKDLQRMLRMQLEPDLRERCKVPEIGAAVKAEYEKAKKAKRTAQSFEDWRSDYMTQIGAAWILSCVFARFLEDNQLVDPPKLSGPGDRLQRARDEYDLYVQQHPAGAAREYLLFVFDGLAELPGGKDIFGKHNLVHEQRGWISGDAAKELRNFWQRIDPATGKLIHDFTDPEWDTRFLGDLYQDLSEAAQKKYALLQTPEFVEEFILDRTLEPALDEFGVEAPAIKAHYDQPTTPAGFRMIDPACGSGHFLLGAFRHILDRWQKKEPGTTVRELVLRTLKSVNGVDLNPFAVAISRFRLLLAAMRACGFRRLKDSIAFEIRVACGDALLHGPDTAVQKKLIDEGDTQHTYWIEDLPLLRQILRNKHYHCVVANPPYITPKDQAANNAYRRLYPSCHRQYSLAVPFMERIFRLAIQGHDNSQSAGYTGQITANSFMKREFGKKLIEEFFQQIDLTHVIDTGGAHIPGHGTPTVILFGRNRSPVSNRLRVVLGIRGEPTTPSDASRGRVWRSIIERLDYPGQRSEFIEVADQPRGRFSKHPLSMAGGGAVDLIALIESSPKRLSSDISVTGRAVGIGEEDAYTLDSNQTARRISVGHAIHPFVVGESVRDWTIDHTPQIVYPYAELGSARLLPFDNKVFQYLWYYRALLRTRTIFGGTLEERGRHWCEYLEHYGDRVGNDIAIAYGNIATHNHFCIDRQHRVYNCTAPVILLNGNASEARYTQLLSVLNSSVLCFWLRQVSNPKGSSGIGRGVYDEAWEKHVALSGTKVKQCPLPKQLPTKFAASLDQMAKQLADAIPTAALRQNRREEEPLREALAKTKNCGMLLRGEMIRLQEDVDWECYKLYGLIDEELTSDTKSLPIALGQRAFEIILARKMARGEVQTTWFERHGSTPITELPDDWPDDYKKLVERRIEVIESNPQIALIEQPEYKRRWNTEPWDSQVELALRSWLLDRLESYFDFDGRMNEEGIATADARLSSPCLISTAQLADIGRADRDFMEVASVYRDRTDFDVARLVAELVADESVPLLPVLRYKGDGPGKRQAWERTWQLQRMEDHIEAELTSAFTRDDAPPALHDAIELADADEVPFARDVFFDRETMAPLFQQLSFEELVKRAKEIHIGEIPVPPKYKSSDFQSSVYWRLRGKLDVPKERWVSFPHCEGEDQSLVIAWAGYDHLQLTNAVAAFFADVQQTGGSEDPRLVPLLGCILELNPWVKQWHNDVDPDFGYRLGDYFANFVEDEARTLGKTVDDIKAWQPPAKKSQKKKRTKKS